MLTVRALEESTWPDFARLVEANNGVFGGCWCMGMHPDEPGATAPKRERKLERVRAGTAHAALVHDGEDCLGWVQFGPPAQVARIKNRAAAEKGATEPPDWRIGCHVVGKGHRRRGVATAGLAGALELIGGRGGGVVEGYPEPAGAVPAGFSTTARCPRSSSSASSASGPSASTAGWCAPSCPRGRNGP